MRESKAHVSFFIDGSRPAVDGRCLIKLTVYQNRQKKRYATNFHVTKEDWVKLNSSNLRDVQLKDIKRSLNKLKHKAEDIIKEIVPFSFVSFEEVFYSVTKEVKSRLLEEWLETTVSRLRANDQIGTAASYKTTINSLKKFKRNLQIQDVTTKLLRTYEKYLLAEGKTTATVGIYMRNIRAIMNEAIDAKLLTKENYPFQDYEIPTGQNVKKALRDFDIEQLLKHEPVNPDLKKALDFWIFSYLCSGMNFADIIRLKPENISGNYLSFYREKTKRTKKKDLRPIKVGLSPRAISIIASWKNTDPHNPYLFPILEKGLSAVTIKRRCQRIIKWVNKRMYIICSELGIQNKASTYAARHTFSTVLKRKGVPTSFIKDALGHSSIITTENYLDSFEDDVKLEYANLLTTFK